MGRRWRSPSSTTALLHCRWNRRARHRGFVESGFPGSTRALFPGRAPSPGRMVQGNLACLLGDRGLEVVDVTDPSNPFLKGQKGRFALDNFPAALTGHGTDWWSEIMVRWAGDQDGDYHGGSQ